jgi:hypothetical protein
MLMTQTHNSQAAADQARAAYRDMTDQLGHLGLDTPIPEGMRALAEKTVAQSREAYDRSKKALDAGQGAAALNRKMVDIARRNVDTSFALAESLMGAKTLADMMKLQADFWRKQFGVWTAQAEEVRALSTKVTADAAEPIKAQLARNMDEARKVRG